MKDTDRTVGVFCNLIKRINLLRTYGTETGLKTALGHFWDKKVLIPLIK